MFVFSYSLALFFSIWYVQMSSLPPKKRKRKELLDKIDIVGISQHHKMARDKGGPPMYQGADSDGTPINLEYEPLPARVAGPYSYPPAPVPKPSEEESEESSPSQKGGSAGRTRKSHRRSQRAHRRSQRARRRSQRARRRSQRARRDHKTRKKQ